MHCWQGYNVLGFDNDGGLTGGIQTTGNYPGRARAHKELMVYQEEMKTAPFGDVWEEYLKRENIKSDYLTEVKEYEKNVLSVR